MHRYDSGVHEVERSTHVVVVDVDVVLQQSCDAVLQVEPVGQALLMHATSIK